MRRDRTERLMAGAKGHLLDLVRDLSPTADNGLMVRFARDTTLSPQLRGAVVEKLNGDNRIFKETLALDLNEDLTVRYKAIKSLGISSRMVLEAFAGASPRVVDKILIDAAETLAALKPRR